MKVSQNGIDLIKKFEGLRLEPYLCSAKKPTIGYGSTFYPDGTPVKMTDSPITDEQAEQLLIDTLKPFERKVNRSVKVKLTQNQFDALVSHTFNTGGSETLFEIINRKCDISMIRNWWTTTYISANKTVLRGLVNRRKEEFELFIS